MQARQTSTPLTSAVMVHLYRGLMDRTTTWRTRIDGTTNWAVVSVGSLASFLLSDPSHPHLIALLGMFLSFAFLVIESRRFRFYDLWSGWLRMMETDWYVTVLHDNAIEPVAQWHALLMNDLDTPHFKIRMSEAMGRRLRHNYFWLFLFLLMVWLVKLLPSGAASAGDCATVVQCAQVGPLPGAAVIGLVAGFYAYLIGLMLFTPKLVGTGTELISRHILYRRMVAPSAQLVGFKRHHELDFMTDEAARAPEED